jgi:hypothetical protein
MANEQSTKVNRSVTIGGVSIGGTVQTVTTDLVTAFQKTIPTGTNTEVDITVDISTCKVMAIEADNDCTVKTNSTSAPDDTLALKARQPLIWADGDPSGLQFLTADVTKFYVTTTTATLLKFGSASDSTPVLS